MQKLAHIFNLRRALASAVVLSVFFFVAGFASVASAAELVREFNGRSSKTTVEFEVKAPWIIDWRTRSEYPGQGAFELTLLDSPSDQYAGKVAATKWVDNGIKMFNEGGRYKLQVDSSLIEWTLRVEQLTKKEAENYTVKEGKKPAY